MSVLLVADHLHHEWPGRKVLDDVSISLNGGDCVGLVGPNASGKSTLISALAGKLSCDSGSITRKNNLHVGLLAQKDDFNESMTVREAVFGGRATYEWAQDKDIRQIVDALIGELDLEAQISQLSGGQRRRCDLSRVLIEDWDLLLLDEPTNHLDMVTIDWLAQHLKERWQGQSGALVLVTHDRWFLDEVCTSMWELHRGNIVPFEGGWSAYVQQRFERDRQATVAERRRQSILRKELAWLARGAQARSTKPRFRVEAARELAAQEGELRDTLELRRLALKRLGKKVISCKNLSFGYTKDRSIIKSLDWLIGPGERIGILGANGSGKSSLLGLITGQLKASSGSIELGSTVHLGTLSQGLDSLQDKADWKVSELLAELKQEYQIGGKSYSIQSMVEDLGFSVKETFAQIKSLSGGQKRRLALLCVLLSEPNVLILDEPGNDLDTDMLAALENILDTWPGSLLLVTHDRHLMDRCVDNHFALFDGELIHMTGGSEQYLELEKKRGRRTNNTNSELRLEIDNEQLEPKHEAQLSNAERQEYKRRIGFIGRRLQTLEKLKADLTKQQAGTDPYNFEELMRIQSKLEALDTEQNALEEEWLEKSELLGEIL